MIPKKHGRVTIKGDDGKEHSGYYHVDIDLLKVHYEDKYEKAFLHSAEDPESMARIMLANIIKNAPKA